MVMSRVMLSEMLSEMSPKGFYTDFFFFLFFLSWLLFPVSDAPNQKKASPFCLTDFNLRIAI